MIIYLYLCNNQRKIKIKIKSKEFMKHSALTQQLTEKMNNEDQISIGKQNQYTNDETLRDDAQPVGYKQLFYFADRLDWVIMTIAIIFSFGNGISIIFYALPIKQLISAFSPSTPTDQIVQATIKSVYGFLINSAILFVNCWFMTAAWTITSQRQMNRARKKYFQALLAQELSWHDRNKPALICSKMYIQISKVQQGLITNMTSVLNKISIAGSGIIMALAVGYQMALVMIAFIPVMMGSGYIRAYFMKQKDMYMQTKKVKLDSDVIQVFDNIKTIKMLNSEEYERRRYEKCLKKQQLALWSFGWKGSFAFTFFFFCIILNYALGFWYGAKLITERTINANTGQLYNTSEVIIIFFILYISNLNLSGLPDSLASFSVCRYSMSKIISIISRVPKMKDGTERLDLDFKSITFNNVLFQYERPLFKNLNLKLKKGRTAFIGESGCGKSTIISLLMRFYDPIKGQILFEGENQKINIKQVRNDCLRQKIGYVGQEPVLIGKTIRDVLMAENISDSEVYSVLKLVKADKFVRDIGLYSQFKSVSGGQKQRLAIARALLKKPKVLILDESTSALDHKTQQQVLKNISKSGIQFIIMVAHRFETLTYADEIIRVKADQIQLIGNYEELKKQNTSEIKKIKEQMQSQQKHSQNFIQEQIVKKIKQIDLSAPEGSQNDNETEEKEKQIILSKFAGLQFQLNYLFRLMKLNGNRWFLFVLGILGAVYFGSIFPIFSYLITRIIFLLNSLASSNSENLQANSRQANALSVSLFIISFGSLIFTTMRWVIFQYFNEKVGYLAKLNAFSRLIGRKYAEIQEEQPHSYSYIINKSCDDLKPLGGNFLPMIIQNLVTLIVGLGIAFYFCWKVTAITLFIMPLLLLSSKFMMAFNHGMQSNTEQIHKKNHQLVITSIMHLKTIKSCHLEQKVYEKYGKQLDGALKYSIKYGNIAGMLFGIGQTLISCTLAVIFLIASVLIKNQLVDVQSVITSSFAVMFAGVQAGGNLYFLTQLPAAKNGASVYFNIIDNSFVEEPFIQQASEQYATQSGASITFDKITFGYQKRNSELFKNFSLEIKNNEKVAIVGQSGSGKSTLINLLFKLYSPLRGSILIDGQQISKIPKNRLSKMLGIVMQEPALFNRSVYQNIKYTTSLAHFQNIEEVCKATNSYGFIMEGKFGLSQNDQNQLNLSIDNQQDIPQGFHKLVGPRGSYLSGGQKQRIAIARALVRKPKVLILDEATSALDPQNEKLIKETMQGIKGITQIVIAHRLSTIKNCDRIIVMKNGEIIEEGTYTQLMKKDSYFNSLATDKRQNKSVIMTASRKCETF